MFARSSAAAILFIVVLTPDAGAVAPPPTASPGATTGLVSVSGPCPGFSWGSVPGADRYELALYAFADDGTVEAAPSLRETFPGSVTGWTPSLDRCLQAGRRYAWTVRAWVDGAETDWAESRFFRLAEVPSVTEVEEALQVLRRYLGDRPERSRIVVADSPRKPKRPGDAAPQEGTKRESTAAEIGAGDVARAAATQLPEALRSGTLPANGPSPRTITPPATYSLSLSDELVTRRPVFYQDKGGTRVLLHSDGGVFYGNTAIGLDALISSTPGSPSFFDGAFNTAVGYAVLQNNTQGGLNTAVGTTALFSNTDGDDNTAVGTFALFNNTHGFGNTALGSRALQDNTVGSTNTAVGRYVLYENTTGSVNTAIGVAALRDNTLGDANTATGVSALRENTEGDLNTATGRSALAHNTIGVGNTAGGYAALLYSYRGDYNTATGVSALRGNIYGHYNTATGAAALRESYATYYNTAIGAWALANTYIGDSNIALGHRAGTDLRAGDNNIYIGNRGEDFEDDTIRIGSSHSSTFIAGIRDTNVGSGIQVLVGGLGRLGTTTSSRRFKQEIADMGDASAALLSLRPVTFRYTEDAIGDGPRPVDFGLIAEEVAEIYPDLVAYDEEGRPYSVRYHVLPAMLLNEIQRQHERVRAHEIEIGELHDELQRLLGRRDVPSAAQDPVRLSPAVPRLE